MKPFSFVHAADLHLGYAQYGLEARRQDFDNAFKELVDKTIELKPDFMIIAGDLFHQPRPSNVTLENTIRSFKRLKDAGIPVLTVDGSHDSAPNTITGTILYPLDSAGLIHHLPRHEGACWRKPDCCYVYGIPNFHNRHKTQEALPKFMAENPPTPEAKSSTSLFSTAPWICQTLSRPTLKRNCRLTSCQSGFNYYAAGHVHERFLGKFKDGILVLQWLHGNCRLQRSKIPQRLLHVKVNEKGEFNTEPIELASTRRFVILEQDFTGMASAKITELATQLLKTTTRKEPSLSQF